MVVCVKVMSKGSKQALTVLIATHVTQVKRVKSGVCSFYATLHTEYRYSFCYPCQKVRKYQIPCTVLCIQGLSPLQGGKVIYLKAFHLAGLAVHHQPVRGGSFVYFLGLVKLQGWLQARCTANPQFLKLRGAQQPGNSYISTTKLHPPYPNILPAKCNSDLKSASNAWRMLACIISLEVAGAVSGKVGSHEQVD